MDVKLALKINRLVHNECKDVPHDIGIKIEELVRLHQSELKNCFIPDVSNAKRTVCPECNSEKVHISYYYKESLCAECDNKWYWD